MDWTLQAAGAADAEFLYRVYAGTRLEELAPTGWTAEQIESFLRSQFALQDHHYRLHYPAASFDIVKARGESVGRLVVDRAPAEIRVIDIALLPAYRRLGLGRALLQALQAEAQASGRRIALHVERSNPALGLYRQLGFEVVADDHGVYLQMHWPAPRCAGTAGVATASSVAA